jgi:hypothetical protein
MLASKIVRGGVTGRATARLLARDEARRIAVNIT